VAQRGAVRGVHVHPGLPEPFVHVAAGARHQFEGVLVRGVGEAFQGVDFQVAVLGQGFQVLAGGVVAGFPADLGLLAGVGPGGHGGERVLLEAEEQAGGGAVDFVVEGEGDAAPGEDEQQGPGPKAAGAVEVEGAFVAAGAPAEAPGFGPACPEAAGAVPGVAAARRWEGEPGADEAVQGPEQGDDAEDPGADGAQGQGVVQAVDKGHQVGEALAEVAPQAAAEDLAGVGVHEHFVDGQRRRTRFGAEEEAHRAVGVRGREHHPVDVGVRVGGVHLVAQGEGREQFAVRGRGLDLQPLRVDQGVELVIPHQQRAGEAGDDQEACHHQPDVAVQDDEPLAHCHCSRPIRTGTSRAPGRCGLLRGSHRRTSRGRRSPRRCAALRCRCSRSRRSGSHKPDLSLLLNFVEI